MIYAGDLICPKSTIDGDYEAKKALRAKRKSEKTEGA
jgi:hypothetical protein